MNKLIVLVGLSGSGKSSYSTEIADKFSAKILTENVENQSINEILLKTLRKEIASRNVIIDANNIDSRARLNILEQVKHIPCEKICIVIDKPLRDCLIDNRNRLHSVSDEMLLSQYDAFTYPSVEEGWDIIKVIKPNRFFYDRKEQPNEN